MNLSAPPVLATIAPYTRGAKELRVKKSDRIALIVQNLKAMGAQRHGIPPYSFEP